MFIFCYWRILATIRSRMRVAAEISTNAGRPTDRIAKHPANTAFLRRSEINSVKTFVIITVLFIICWSPSNLYYLLFNFRQVFSFADIDYYVTVFMVFCNVCVNPFVYAAKYDAVKKRLLEVISGIGRSNHPPTMATTGKIGQNQDGKF